MWFEFLFVWFGYLVKFNRTHNTTAKNEHIQFALLGRARQFMNYHTGSYWPAIFKRSVRYNVLLLTRSIIEKNDICDINDYNLVQCDLDNNTVLHDSPRHQYEDNC